METHFRCRETYIMKMKEYKKISHANRNKKTARITILTSDNILK